MSIILGNNQLLNFFYYYHYLSNIFNGLRILMHLTQFLAFLFIISQNTK